MRTFLISILIVLCNLGNLLHAQNLARYVSPVLQRDAERLFASSINEALQRSGQLALEAGLGNSMRVPAQTVALVPMTVADIEAQVIGGNYGTTLVSSLIAQTAQNENDKLLYNDFFTLSLQGARPALQDRQKLVQLFIAQAKNHLEPFLSKNVSSTSLLEADKGAALIKLAADIAGIGLYGSAMQKEELLSIYHMGSQSKIEPMLQLWTVRALLAIGADDVVLPLVSHAPESPVQREVLTFLNCNSVSNQTSLQISEAFAPLKPVLQTTAPNMVFAFDISPVATTYFLTWRKMLDTSTPAPANQAEKMGPVKLYAKLNHLFHRAYPSGLLDEERLISDWLEYYSNGYFKPRNQIEVIEGMSPAKANNIMEYLYYMSMEDAERLILDPLRQTGKLPQFMYTGDLIENTYRLPFGYYKNKFNKNVARFVELAEQDGTIYTDNVELKDLAISMKDYTFKQGFLYPNSPELTAGLKANWDELVTQITQRGLRADRDIVNELWRRPVHLPDGTQVSLKDYFTQTRRSFASNRDVTPSFYLNSPKWVAWENERRNLKAKEWFPRVVGQEDSLAEQLRKKITLGNPDDYLTLEQFGQVMRSLYLSAYGKELGMEEQALSDQSVFSGFRDEKPSSTTIKINNFDKSFGMCIAPMNEQYIGRVEAGYDGTSTVSRFEPVVFDEVEVVIFDPHTLEVSVKTIDKVSYLKDLKKPDIDKVRASTMVGDGIDFSRDLLTVERAEQALVHIPSLRATIYPKTRLSYADKIPYMTGGGLPAYLALFTEDFYPIKTIKRLKKVDGKYTWVPEYYVRKEVAALAGMIARERLAFTSQIEDRIIK